MPAQPDTTGSHGLHFPPERPLTSAELDKWDARRLQPVIATLVEGLCSYWDSRGQARADRARVWGLHGGLGQGKSTVIKQALRSVQDDDGAHPIERPIRPRLHPWLWARLFTLRFANIPGLRRDPVLRRELDVKWIEASHIKADRIRWNLLSHLVIPRLLANALPMAVLTTALVLFLAHGLLLVAGTADGLFPVLDHGMALVSLVSGLGLATLIFKWANQKHSDGGLERLLFALAEWTGCAPDLVILDDLDRATVEQQRTVLQTLVRHTEWLRCPLLVCFDESDLLRSEPNPEDPAELLRKLIQVPLRLPPRGREDAVLLARVAAEAWLALNPGRTQWAAFLRDPIWQGHLARILVVAEGVNPRHAKSLVAEVMTGVEAFLPCRPAGAPTGLQGSANGGGPVMDLDDASALLLLSALHQLHPALRRNPDGLLACLEAGGQTDAWNAWRDLPGAKPFFLNLEKSPRHDAQLAALLRLSDLMMPVRTGWRRLMLLRREGEPVVPPRVHSPGPATAPLPLDTSAVAYDLCLRLGQTLDQLAIGAAGPAQLGAAKSTGQAGAAAFKEFSAADWPLLLLSARLWTEAQRLQAFPLVESWLRSRPDLRPCLLAWQAEWVDAEQALCPASSPSGLDRDPADDRLGLVRLREQARQVKSSTDAKRVWLLGLDLVGRVDEHLLTTALCRCTNLTPDLIKPEEIADRPEHALRIWPAYRIPGSAAQLRRELPVHLKALQAVMPNLTWEEQKAARRGAERSLLAFPQTLAAWFHTPAARELSVSDWLEAFQALCEPADSSVSKPGADPPMWAFGRWLPFVPLVSQTSAFRQAPPNDWPSALQGNGSALWCSAMCLMAQGWSLGHSPSELVQKLWPDAWKARPEPSALPLSWVHGAVQLWIQSSRDLMQPQSEAESGETASQIPPWGALALSREHAQELLDFLLGVVRHPQPNDNRESMDLFGPLQTVWEAAQGCLDVEFHRRATSAFAQIGLVPPDIDSL